ncbi:sugar phosphate nucleotidyltransferase, partial [Microvirga sp. KLBC 81]|uniref:sugar phosphate nucleotidyltransferase n=1 Tax=Microvirga sp. KLBC 81 TaxID=1862707 RepID=UPI001FE086CE
MPKPFIKLLGDLSTFQAAVLRVSTPDVFLRPIILAGNDVRFIVAEQLAEIGVEADIVLEPVRRDSAAAVAAAACYVAERHSDAVVVTLPADHVIEDRAAFARACQKAGEVARTGAIMTIGIRPKHPATSYGYIKPGACIQGTDAFHIERF